jgi:dihydroxyacetone kinase-like protein
MAQDTAWVAEWARLNAATIAAHRAELTDLDRAIGDGDHGENMDRGFGLVPIEELAASSSPGGALRTIAMTLISKVGGAAGPLYGTAFLRASEAAGTEADLSPTTIAAVLRAARDGIVQRGKAELGDKTMVDAWSPAVDAADAAVSSGLDGAGVLAAAATAAEAGAAATDSLVARKGRASYLGERSVGHRDPGAESTALILRAAADAASASASGHAGVEH